MVKKTLILLFGVFAILASVALLLPVFFDANKHLRPYIENAITDILDADPKIGNLSVSLWGKAKIHINDLEIIDRSTAKSIFKVADAQIEVPLVPLLRKTIQLRFLAKDPSLLIVSETQGINWTRILKKKAPTGASEEITATRPNAQPSTQSKPSYLEGMKIIFDTEIENARISYEDGKSQTILSDLDFTMSDFSLSEPFKYKLTTRLDSKKGSTVLNGPAEISGTVKLFSEGSVFQGLNTNGRLDLDRTELTTSGFEKSKGEALNFNFTAEIRRIEDQFQTKLKIDSTIESVLAKANVEIKKFSPLEASIDLNAPKIDLQKLAKLNVHLADVFATIRMSGDKIFVTQSRMRLFKGEYHGTALFSFSGNSSQLNFKGRVSGIDINEAIASQMPDLKDTLKGTLSSDYVMNTNGSQSEDFKKNLSGSGSANISNGSWSALYGLKMLGEKLNGIPGVKERIGELKVGDSIQTAKTNFKIAKQKIFLSSTVIDLKDSKATVVGDGDVGFNKQIQFKGFLIAPLGEPPAALRNPDGRVKLPFEFSGAVNGPNINWNVTTDAVTKAYLRQEGRKLIEQVKDQIQDKNLKKLLDQAPEGLDKLLKDIKL